MRPAILLAFLLGAASGATTMLWSTVGTDPAPAAATGPAPVPRAAADPTDPTAPTAAGADELRAIRAELTALRSQLEARVDREPMTAPVRIDEDALLSAFVRVREREERQRLEAMTDQELFDAASQLLHAGKTDRPRCKRMLLVLLERPLPPALRGEARLQLARVHRDLLEYDAARTLLQRSRDEFGDGSDAGGRAGIELAQVLVRAGDAPAGVALADRLARTVPEPLRGEARWTAAWAARSAGDLVRARADFGALVRDFEGRDDERWIARSSLQQLAEIEAVGR